MADIPARVADFANMPDEQTHVGRAVRAATAANMANGANSLLMWRHLRVIPSVFVADDTVAVVTTPALVQSFTYRIRWVTSPSARFLWIGFYPFAIEQTAGVTIIQEVKAEVRFTGGVQIDGDIFWRFTPASPASPGHGRLWLSGAPAAGARHAGNAQVGSTGWDQEIDPAYQGPRMLDLGTNQADDVEVILTTTQCRLYGAVVIEAFRRQVT